MLLYYIILYYYIITLYYYISVSFADLYLGLYFITSNFKCIHGTVFRVFCVFFPRVPPAISRSPKLPFMFLFLKLHH